VEKQVEITRNVTISNKYGLHARPAMQFVELATKYVSRISIGRGDKLADAKSIMEVLMLAAENGTEITIRADGDDAEEAIDALLKLVARKFDEE
jgi:phosphocarrier protein HPr